MNDMNKQMHYVLYHSDETDVSVNAVVQNGSIWATGALEITSDFDKEVKKMLESNGGNNNA